MHKSKSDLEAALLRLDRLAHPSTTEDLPTKKLYKVIVDEKAEFVARTDYGDSHWTLFTDQINRLCNCIIKMPKKYTSIEIEGKPDEKRNRFNSGFAEGSYKLYFYAGTDNAHTGQPLEGNTLFKLMNSFENFNSVHGGSRS